MSSKVIIARRKTSVSDDDEVQEIIVKIHSYVLKTPFGDVMIERMNDRQLKRCYGEAEANVE